MSISASTILLPAPDASWRLVKPRSSAVAEEVESPAEAAEQARPLVIGLPASACRTIGLILPQADPEVLEQMVETQLERRGLHPHTGAGANFRWHLLGPVGGHVVISVDVLAEPFPESLAVAQASDYTSALRLLDLPAGHIVVVEEQGELVIAAGHAGKLFHSHVFAPISASPEEVSSEISLCRMVLEAEPGFGTITGVTLVGTSWEKQRIAGALDLPVETRDSLQRNTRLDTSNWTRLLPTTVRAAQVAQVRHKTIVRYLILGALLYVALGFLAYAWLTVNQKKVEALAAEVAETNAPAEAVRTTATQWKTLAPAVEVSHFPMVALSAITRLLPPSGVVIREFEFKNGVIDLKGEARDADTVVTFMESIKAQKVLALYEWTNPQPSVKEKNASFRAQGKLK